jgi:hypothetical protein
MRASLLHPLTERHSRRSRPERQAIKAYRRKALPEAEPEPAPQPRDIAAERVRAAGGPLDQAAYACGCGYLFAAPVSTTVRCPHCGASQAW